MSPEPAPAQTFEVLGISVSVTNLDQAAARIHSWSTDAQGRFVCVRDVHGVMLAQSDPAFAALHRQAAMVTPDGMPLVWLGRLAGLPVGRTCGADLMQAVFSRSGADGPRHLLFGGKPGVAELLQRRLLRRFPQAKITAAPCPPFRDPTPEEIDHLAETIRAVGADIVWIGLSTPRQEFLMAKLAPKTSATLIGVGAAFDFHAGTVRRAPRWMQVSGLEWLHRLASDPLRLWRRYLLLAPRFVLLVLVGRR